MYPVGVLFGFGFDTASSIALLAITALAKKRSDGRGTINQSDIIVLPLLFTCGMTLVDSVDSIIMLYSYAGFPSQGWSIWEKKTFPSQAIGPTEPTGLDHSHVQANTTDPPSSCLPETEDPPEQPVDLSPCDISTQEEDPGPMSSTTKVLVASPTPHGEVEGVRNLLQSIAPDRHPDSDLNESAQDEELKLKLMLKHNTMSSLSIALTLVSILVSQFASKYFYCND